MVRSDVPRGTLLPAMKNTVAISLFLVAAKLPQCLGTEKKWSYNESASPEWSCTLDIPNAFIGKTSIPSTQELSAALGSSLAVWNKLIDSLLADPDVTEMEWNSLKPKYGWNLIAKSKKRRIVYLGPCAGCFRVSFVLGDRAMAAARASSLSKAVFKILDEAPHYPEGTGVRLLVKNAKDLGAVRKLAKIKLAY